MTKLPLPKTTKKWLKEINLAIEDAADAQPFGKLIGSEIADADLFHLAPLVCMKFRGLNLRDEVLRERVTEGALANYVVNSGSDAPAQDVSSKPKLAFALCYVASHLVLDLIDEQEADDILCACEERLDEGRRGEDRSPNSSHCPATG